MPGDPNECREHATNCTRLACTSQTAEMRDHFTNLATAWTRLADELEQTQILLNTIEEAAPPRKVVV